MKVITITVVAIIALVTFAAPVGAGWDEGIAAFERGDYQSALVEFHDLADQGDPDGQIGLGVMYSGGYGVMQDYAQAAHWYRLAAEQDSAMAQFKLGDLYYRGLGVTQDYVEAARWVDRAAHQGYLEAQQNIAVMHALGEGVPFNLVQAYAWFALAAAQTSSEAAEGVSLVAESMSASEIAEAVAIAEAWMAEQNYETALWDVPALDVSAPLGARGNPVRVDGPSGEREYLNQLRCSEGDAPQYERLGSVGEGPYGRILDIYDLLCMAGGRSAQLYMDMYHPDIYLHDPVPGFTFVPVQAPGE